MTVNANTSLTYYTAAKKALAQVRRVDEVKDVRDKAMAMQLYAKQANDFDLSDYSTEIRMRAEVRAGELLIEMKKNGQRASKKQNLKVGEKSPKSRGVTSGEPKLFDLGVSKMQSHRWQKLAALPAAEIEARIATAKTATHNAMIRGSKRRAASKQQQPEPVSPPATVITDTVATRMGDKIVNLMSKSFRSLLPAERRELLEMLRLNIDAMEKKYVPAA